MHKYYSVRVNINTSNSSHSIAGHRQAYNTQCRDKQKQFIMVKTEKTGSSTLFSILARFILTNQLNVMVMTRGGHLDVTKQRGESPGKGRQLIFI